MIRHVIFDGFGTLLDTGTGSMDAARAILRSVGSGEEPSVFYGRWKAAKKNWMRSPVFRTEKELFVRSLQETFEECGIRADASREAEPMLRSLFGHRPLFPDVRPVLEMLNGKGIDYAIGSTTDTDSLYHFLRENALSMAYVFTSEQLRAYKPDPRFYAGILEATRWRAEECLFVGDSPEEDTEGPGKAGMHTALLDRKGVYAGRQLRYTPDAVIRSLTELTELLPKIDGPARQGGLRNGI